MNMRKVFPFQEVFLPGDTVLELPLSANVLWEKVTWVPGPEGAHVGVLRASWGHLHRGGKSPRWHNAMSAGQGRVSRLGARQGWRVEQLP